MESDDQFWLDTSKAQEILKEKASLDKDIKEYQLLFTLKDDFKVLDEFASEGDFESLKEALTVFRNLSSHLDDLEQKALLSDEMDSKNAIVSINAGAGGTESCDWAFMLGRMVLRYADIKNFKHKILDSLEGETAGVKSMTLLLEGEMAYGFLKSETGIHRLVRISPFDSSGRRHTSFASIFVTPEIDDSIEIEVLEKDIRIDVFRSGGAGGQSVNTTDSAVRITHFPSNIVVTCQNERSQLQNKMTAMKILKSRLYEKALEEKRKDQKELEASKKEIGWGSQIRSYVLHPYKMVKDHRTLCESSNAEKVLDGHLDEFIKSYLLWNRTGQTAKDLKD